MSASSLLDNGVCTVEGDFNLPPLLYCQPSTNGDEVVFTTVSLGIEGSANKIGVGIIRCTCTRSVIDFQNSPSQFDFKYTYEILCNPRKTYITPAGQGNMVSFSVQQLFDYPHCL